MTEGSLVPRVGDVKPSDGPDGSSEGFFHSYGETYSPDPAFLGSGRPDLEGFPYS